eukprot:2135042-Rhodomonas_salina.1
MVAKSQQDCSPPRHLAEAPVLSPPLLGRPQRTSPRHTRPAASALLQVLSPRSLQDGGRASRPGF